MATASTYLFDAETMRYVSCGACNGKGRVAPPVTYDKRKAGDNRTYDEMARPVRCRKCNGVGFVIVMRND